MRRFATAFLLILLIAACDPLAPIPTPTAVVMIVTPENTPTPPPSPTPTITPLPSATPEPSATPAPTVPPCADAAGQIIDLELDSETAGETLEYRVYVPPCYAQFGRRYPVAYLLHGLGQNEDEWASIGLIDALEQGLRLGVIAPMLVVMPTYGAIGGRNAYPPDDSYETVLLGEVVPRIERDFCTINDSAHRALGGISRGGFWAYSIGLRNPDRFGILGGHSASLDADNAPATANPLDLALNSPFLLEAGLRLYFDNGAEDPAGTELELLSSRLSSRGIPHEYAINPVGGHDAEYWSSHIAEYLTFYARTWERSTALLPSCLEPSP